MSTVLHIDASPRGEGSFSAQAARHFIESLRQREPGLHVDRLELWEADLPQLDGDALDAKYAVLQGRPHGEGEARAWAQIRSLIERLARADKVVLSTPMWNMSLPYKLKHYIDLVTQPTLSFSFDPVSGYAPLLAPRPVMLIVASAGDFASGESWGRPDLATPYLTLALAFIGLSNAAAVAVGPTAGPAAKVEAGRERAYAALNAAALTF